MVTMKFAFVSLTLFVLLEAYDARHLHDASIKGSFERPPLFQTVVIQMVTGVEELRLPQSPPSSSSHDQTTYGRGNPSPPPPKVAPSTGEATYNRVNSSPPPPIIAPSGGQSTYERVNSSPPMGPNKHGRVDPRTPLSPNPNDSQGHGILYGRVDPSAPAPPKPADPTCPLVSDGGSACIGLSTSTVDRRKNLCSTPVFTSDV